MVCLPGYFNYGVHVSECQKAVVSDRGGGPFPVPAVVYLNSVYVGF